jgi:hypothetical protein
MPLENETTNLPGSITWVLPSIAPKLRYSFIIVESNVLPKGCQKSAARLLHHKAYYIEFIWNCTLQLFKSGVIELSQRRLVEHPEDERCICALELVQHPLTRLGPTSVDEYNLNFNHP